LEYCRRPLRVLFPSLPPPCAQCIRALAVRHWRAVHLRSREKTAASRGSHREGFMQYRPEPAAGADGHTAGLIRALLGLRPNCRGAGLEDEAAGVAVGIGAASGRAADAIGWPERRSRVGLVPWTERVDSTVGRSQKAAAHGRGAPALLRTPPRGLFLARLLCLGPSHTSQRRHPATRSEGGWPALAAESRRRRPNHAAGRQ
jgi:hypothetical protein